MGVGVDGHTRTPAFDRSPQRDGPWFDSFLTGPVRIVLTTAAVVARLAAHHSADARDAGVKVSEGGGTVQPGMDVDERE